MEKLSATERLVRLETIVGVSSELQDKGIIGRVEKLDLEHEFIKKFNIKLKTWIGTAFSIWTVIQLILVGVAINYFKPADSKPPSTDTGTIYKITPEQLEKIIQQGIQAHKEGK